MSLDRALDAVGGQNFFVSSLEWRAECKKRAYRTVLSLIEPGVTPCQLIESAPTLDPAHYEDVVEERHLGHLCGYPLCDNPVNKSSQQKFHISVKNKKVYDLSERKQFCSGWCYKASQYFASQLSTIPLWARQNEILPTIELLNKASKSEKDVDKYAININSTPGDTADIPSAEESVQSFEHLHISDTRTDKERKVNNGIDQLDTETMVDSNNTSLTNYSDYTNNNKPVVSLSSESKPSNVSSDHKPQLTIAHQMKAGLPKDCIGPKHYGAPVQKLPPRDKVMSALLQWKTPETVRFLAGSLPDYGKSDDSDDESLRNCLPMIDSHNQMSLRRRIATQQLMKGLSPILCHVGLTTLQVSGDIVAIVTTFNLQPNNISFQPSLWTAVAAILLLLVRRVNKDLASSISIESMLPFISKADMSEDDVQKCLGAFKS